MPEEELPPIHEVFARMDETEVRLDALLDRVGELDMSIEEGVVEMVKEAEDRLLQDEDENENEPTN